ncbi:uncharacterized protein EDB91DRAFT_851282 [Suillus paluster]|uniref:uncharacterized protein n=1 Tax=Suillus paluster TaxID=48578 RepID=UPI001B86D7AC|nr:uncharacterized protein EDB91DRAFT_851282 [Suillus paluster]KAG1728623.1 hypothetical protein EDB91DRAFT_851282 [Suillus paluster]
MQSKQSMMNLFEVNVQNYYQRLFDHHLIPDPQVIQDSSLLSPHCPVCSHRLYACIDCRFVACNSPTCASADLVPGLVCCQGHPYENFCRACFPNAKDSGLFIQCAFCEYWHCEKFMRKCVGRPVTPHQLAREHAPNYFSCYTCFRSASMGKTCSESDCWSRGHDDNEGAICSDCIGSMDGHTACACEETWICGACAQKTVLKTGRRCPRCRTLYCFASCEYIDACVACPQVRLCNDCMELEEDIPGTYESSLANTDTFLTRECEDCDFTIRICADCNGDRDYCCRSCLRVYCQDCMGNGKCSRCSVPVCLDCEMEDGICCECRD